jgi:hypothetical protein
MLNAIMNRDVWPDTMPQWQQAARDEMRKYLAKKAILSFHPQMGNQGNLGTQNQWQHRFGQRGQGGGSSSRDPNVMDVDAISTRNPLSEEETTTHGGRTMFLLQATRAYVQELPKEAQSTKHHPCQPPAHT